MSADHLRQPKTLAREVGGEAERLEAAPPDPVQREHVAARVRAAHDEACRKLIERCEDFETTAGKFTDAEPEENEEDLKRLNTRHATIAALDLYGASLAEEARMHPAQCEALLEAFSHQVFEVHPTKDTPSRGGSRT